MTKEGVPLKLKGKVYAARARSTMIFGSETWAMTMEISNRLQRTEKQMVRWICGVQLSDRVPSEELRKECGLNWCLR